MPKKQVNENQQPCGSGQKLAGRVLALDLGQKRVGVAVSDELRLTARPLQALHRTNWKQLLLAVTELVREFDAKALVIGLPLLLEGTEGEAALEARRLARNFSRSLSIPVFLQDERLTSQEAEHALRSAGVDAGKMRSMVDGEAAAIILRDFIASKPDGPEQASQAVEQYPPAEN